MIHEALTFFDTDNDYFSFSVDTDAMTTFRVEKDYDELHANYSHLESKSHMCENE